MAAGAGVKPWSIFSPIQSSNAASLTIKMKQIIMNKIGNKTAQDAYQKYKQNNNAQNKPSK
ncbi:hypothetical protein PT286_03490 [Neisseriaceae bacterium ESL0693]|nr:hypothetical protein [Neisseriaceae bacterium ESL0693]